MDELRAELEEVRERMVLGVALMQQLADLALQADGDLGTQLERIAVLSYGCVARNLESITNVIDRRPLPLRAA